MEHDKLLTNPLYPILPTAPVIPYDDITLTVEKNLSDARVKEIQSKRDMLNKDLIHYNKILKRWKRCDNAFKGISVVILCGTTMCSIVTGIDMFLSPLFVAIIAGIGASESIISNSLLLALVKKKQHKYKKRIAHINEYISKSWYLFEKIRSDGVISLQEVNEFRVLIEQYEQGLTIESGANVNVNVDNDYVKLRQELTHSLKHKVEKEARKEVKQELMNDLKNEIKERMLQKQK